jgi:hypothetical protein
MGERFVRITLRAGELPGFRAAVIACSRDEERELCEWLLGQLASLEASALATEPGTEFTFAPPPGGAALAQRALKELRAKPLRRRQRRDRERGRRSAVGRRGH